MVSKTRSISAPDFGDRTDNKRLGSTISIVYGSSTFKDWLLNYESKYTAARAIANYAVAPPYGAGIEAFESTVRPRPLFNNCYHSKRYCFNYPYLLVTCTPTSSGSAQSYWRRETPYAARNLSLLAPAPKTSLSSLDDVRSRAWWTMQPRFESEVSMLNFIYELKDFKHLVKSVMNFKWQAFTKKVTKTQEFLRALQTTSSTKQTLSGLGKLANQGSKALADGWLSLSFAWLPLVKDLAEISKNLESTVQAAQEEFAAKGLDVQHTHYSEVLSVATGTKSDIYYTAGGTLALFTATLEYTYLYKMRTNYEAMKKYWGLELTTEVIWNAVPFTFLVDYFLKIGKAIHTMSVDPNVSLNDLQYSESLFERSHIGEAIDPTMDKVQLFYAPSLKSVKDFAAKEISYVPINGCMDVRYQRWVTSPTKGVALPRYKLPSTKQVANMVALVRSCIG